MNKLINQKRIRTIVKFKYFFMTKIMLMNKI